jgi:hypothetical protein
MSLYKRKFLLIKDLAELTACIHLMEINGLILLNEFLKLKLTIYLKMVIGKNVLRVL